MTRIRLPFIHSFIDRHGRQRYYVRRAGRKSVALSGLPGSEIFMSAYQNALDNLELHEIGASRTKPGTVNAAIVAYYAHTSFTADLAPATQRMRRNILERFRAQQTPSGQTIGDKHLATLPHDAIERLLARMKPFAQRNWLKTLRGLMRFAVDARLRPDDPTREIELRRRARSGGHPSWGDDEIARYRDKYPLGTVARIALELMLNVAARRGDAYQLGRQHITKDGRLSWRPRKTSRSTGRPVTVRILPELRAALDAMPASNALTFLTTDHGKPFASAAAFGNKFADWCDEAGLQCVVGDDGRTRNFRAHGLRKAACRRLANAGCTAPEIMAVSGHATLAQAQIYIDEFDRERMAETAMRKVSQIETETEVCKPLDPRSQTGS
jgi:integrase/recombinase XerD